MIDTHTVKQSQDIVALLTADLGPGRKSGRWMKWHCPYHVDGTPSLVATADNGRWHCFGCGKSGDAIAWVQEYHHLDFRKACEYLTAGALPETHTTHSQPLPVAIEPQNQTWQDQAQAFIERSRRNLQSSQEALAYYRKRGLTSATIERWGLGYNPQTYRDTAQSWGLDPTRYPKGVWLPRGYVIPGIAMGRVWYVKIRRLDSDVTPEQIGPPKYISVAGSQAKTLYGSDFLRRDKPVVLLIEGEFNALIAHQELAHRVDVVSVGSASNGIALRWLPYLLHYDTILALYDDDEAGRKGMASLKQLSYKVQRVWLPMGAGDLNEFYFAGGNLHQWLSFHLERLKINIRVAAQPPKVKAAVNADEKWRKGWEAEAQRLGQLYWVLYPMSEHNDDLHKLNQRLEECRDWARARGVLSTLEAALDASAPSPRC